MPGEELLTAAASNWTGQEAVWFGVLATAVLGLGVLLIHHIKACNATTRDLVNQVSEVRANVAYLKGQAEKR